MQEDGETFVSDGDHGKNTLDNRRPNESETSALAQISENGQQETFGKIGPRKKRRKTTLVIDSNSEEDLGDKNSAPDVEDSRKITKDGTVSGTKVYNLNSGMGKQVSNPGPDSNRDPVMEASNKDRTLDQKTSSSPPVNVLFGKGEEDAHGVLGAGSRNEVGEPCSIGSPKPIIEILRKDRELFSPWSVNVVLSSYEEKVICESFGGNGEKGKRRRLIKVQESPGGRKSLQLDPNSEGTKETSPQMLRGSVRLKNVNTSVPKQTTFLSKQDGESASDEGRSEGLGTRGQRSSSKSHVPNDDDDTLDSSDGRPTGALHKLRKGKATHKHKYLENFGDADDEDDDSETDDNDFINDDPESDDPSSDVDENSESGEESDDSSASKSLSEGHKKYNWEDEADMLATLGKDTDLCLRGLCAIFRRQEEDEKIEALTIYKNNRGFSQWHAERASSIASFLMGGTTDGPMVKTVEELRDEFNEDAVMYCCDKSFHYSKQLFEIYENSEDDYFPEPYTGPVM